VTLRLHLPTPRNLCLTAVVQGFMCFCAQSPQSDHTLFNAHMAVFLQHAPAATFAAVKCKTSYTGDARSLGGAKKQPSSRCVASRLLLAALLVSFIHIGCALGRFLYFEFLVVLLRGNFQASSGSRQHPSPNRSWQPGTVATNCHRTRCLIT
jgi:hypothetical protein